MNLEEMIKLHSGDKLIELPLKNILRISMVYINKLLPEFYEETKSNSIKDFFKWIEIKLGMGEGKSVLL